MYFPLTSLSLACVLIASAGAVQGDTLLGQAASGEAVYYALVSEDGSVKTVRTRLVYAQSRTVSDIKDVVASVSVEQIDCNRFTRKTERLELFTSLDPGATPVWTKDLDAEKAQATLVDLAAPTASTSVFKTACAMTSTIIVKTLPAPFPSSAALPASAQSATVPQVRKTLPVALAPASLPTMPLQVTPPVPIATSVVMPAASGTPAPVAAASTSSYRPFPDSVLTLGTMGLLAEYVYYDEAQYAFLQAMSFKMERGRTHSAQDGKPHPLLDETALRLGARLQRYRDKIDAKSAFLAAAGLSALPLPMVRPAPPAAFRAELYKDRASGEVILVFRGTQGGIDWISNLWTGVDLMSIESPHYQAAYQLVAELRQRGISPLVVGHSLGGGMSQYAGAKFGLKVVGFNSAPLPRRYFEDGHKSNPQFVRLFSAIETLQRRGTPYPETMPDPVSINIPDYTTTLNRLLPDFVQIKGHYLLSKPICVQSIPVPTETPDELASYRAELDGVLSAGVASVLLSGVRAKIADHAVIEAIRHDLRTNMSDAVWNPDQDAGVDNVQVAKSVRAEVVNVAIEQYKAAGGVASFAKDSYKVALGDSTRDVLTGLGHFAEIAGKMALRSYLITHLMRPHSMERFNRGMHSGTGVDVFLADPIRAQCQTFDAVK